MQLSLLIIERLHMMSQHSNSLATVTAAILVRNENLLRLCTKMAAVSMAKGCMQTLYWRYAKRREHAVVPVSMVANLQICWFIVAWID